MNIVILGLSITSSWGNSHATTYRGLVKELSKRRHKILFLEKDVPWHTAHKDMPDPEFCDLGLYSTFYDLKKKYKYQIENADLVIVGSYLSQGVEVGDWVQNITKGIAAFYDIDTPVTLSKLERGDYEYISPELIPAYDLYLSATGGPILDLLENEYGSPKARSFYCSFDPDLYHPVDAEIIWDMGYLGTYSDDRQPHLKNLMIDAAEKWPQGKFIVAGAQYPESIKWAENIKHVPHIPPSEHRLFYNSQRFAMNITRPDMIRSGYSPSRRLFEAAACGTPVISDYWTGLTSLFKENESILISRSTKDTLHLLSSISEKERLKIGKNARKVVMENHTAAHRAIELENYIKELMDINIYIS